MALPENNSIETTTPAKNPARISVSKRTVALLGATALLTASVFPLLSSIEAAPAHASEDSISDTSLTMPTGKAEGSGKWGVVGDIDTSTGNTDTTFTYSLAINPTNGAITFTDSGKINWSTSTNAGTPSIHTYSAKTSADGTEDTSYTDYAGNGQFSVSTMAAAGSVGANAGLGKMYADITERADITLPADTKNGPRGIVFTKDGTAWIANSDNGGATSPILRMTSPTTLGESVGYTPKSNEWPKRATPGYLYYPVGVDVDASGTKFVVNSEVSESVHWYDTATNTWSIIALSDIETGADQPTGVAVDKQNGTLYTSLKRDAAGVPALQKRSGSGELISTLHDGLSSSQTVMFASVDPVNGDVYSSSQYGSLQQWDSQGTHLRTFNTAQFPNMNYVRGVEFDSNGRLYVTAAQGTAQTRIMILGKTPSQFESATISKSVDGQSYTINITPGANVDPTNAMYQQTQVLDYIVEAKAEGSSEWVVVEKDPSVNDTQTLTGLDPDTSYEFRTFAINEAGTGDWIPVSLTDTTVESKLVDDAFSTEENTPVTIDVTANDSLASNEGFGDWAFLADPQDPTSVTDTVTVESVGTWTITPEGIVTFTPEDGFVGETPTITIVARSGEHQITQLLSGTVQPIKVVEPTPAPTDPTPVPTDPTPTPTPTDPEPTPTVTPTKPAPTPTVAPDNKDTELPKTGSPVGLIAAFAGLLITGGAMTHAFMRGKSDS